MNNVNKTVKRGEIYFNGYLKYSKRKKVPTPDNAHCGTYSTRKQCLMASKKENVLQNMLVGKIKVNHMVDEAVEMEEVKEKENKGEKDGGNEDKDVDLTEQYEPYTREHKSSVILNNIKERLVRKNFHNGKIKKSSTPKFPEGHNSNDNCVITFLPHNNKGVSLKAENNVVLQTCSTILNGEKGGDNLLKSKDLYTQKKDCALKKNNLHNKKKKILSNKSYNDPAYLGTYQKYDSSGLYDKTYNRKSRNRINEKKSIYKYELPTIASLGKMKNLNYLNFTINENEMNKYAKMILNNLSNIYFEGNVLHNTIQLCKKTKGKKKKKFTFN
ncbi:hypothetical protein MKS88_005478 [Plasmodium brasilianum]|uniref:Uncharacterized protein n=1 Tax=Plasmodium brasilianum TaxID=5824 RepID=A0ACB9Y2F1_PLABR|nr:hypothetical protein MKS88_005478 [Plasmodium brasilianum]